MRVLVIDDEPWARHALREALRRVTDIEVVGEAGDGREALETIDELEPDLIFLDIEMPGMTGLEMLAQTKAGPLVVFVTAFSEYAVKAFEANALDYLLKPLDPDRLLEAVARARERLHDPRANAALRGFLLQARPLSKIAVRRGKKILLLPRDTILSAEIESELLVAYAESGRYVLDRTLSELEEMLDGGGFFRVSRSALVNVEAVEEVFPWMGAGTWRVKLRGGREVDVSRERAKVLRQMLGF